MSVIAKTAYENTALCHNMSFIDLPEDMIDEIAEFLPRHADIYGYAHTCKFFFHIVTRSSIRRKKVAIMDLLIENMSKKYYSPSMLDNWKDRYNIDWKLGGTVVDEFIELNCKLSQYCYNCYTSYCARGCLYISDRHAYNVFDIYDYVMYKDNCLKLNVLSKKNCNILDLICRDTNPPNQYILIDDIASLDYFGSCVGVPSFEEFKNDNHHSKSCIGRYWEFICATDDIDYYGDYQDYLDNKIVLDRFKCKSNNSILGLKLDQFFLYAYTIAIAHYLLYKRGHITKKWGCFQMDNKNDILKLRDDIWLYNGILYVNKNSITIDELENIKNQTLESPKPIYYHKQVANLHSLQ